MNGTIERQQTKSAIRILVLDSQPIVRTGIRCTLERDKNWVVAGDTAKADEALDLLRKQRWDLLVMDLNLADRPGLVILQQVKKERPQLPVLIFTNCHEKLYATRALRNGASGFLDKSSDPDELVVAVGKLLGGGRYVTPSFAESIISELVQGDAQLPHERLSEREYQVFQLIAAGRTASEIARALSLSVKTVSAHRRRLLDKMELRNNAELMYYAVNNGLVQANHEGQAGLSLTQ